MVARADILRRAEEGWSWRRDAALLGFVFAMNTPRWFLGLLAALTIGAEPKPAFKSSTGTESDPRLHADSAGWRLEQATRTDPNRPRVLLIGDPFLSGYLADNAKVK